MHKLTPLVDYAWQSAEIPLCTVDVPVAELAERFGMPLIHWQEAGLGAASGFGCRLESGLVLLLEELAHARECLGAKGPTVYVEASELIEQGVQSTLAKALRGLELSPGNVTWSQDASGLASAENIVRITRERASPR